MESETLSNAQSLRVIGQHLQGISIDTFELEKIGNKYIVWLDRNQPNGKSSTRTGFKSISKMDPAHEKTPTPLHFHGSEILGLEVERRLRRSEAGGMPDAGSLGLGMRVLGQYLILLFSGLCIPRRDAPLRSLAVLFSGPNHYTTVSPLGRKHAALHQLTGRCSRSSWHS